MIKMWVVNKETQNFYYTKTNDILYKPIYICNMSLPGWETIHDPPKQPHHVSFKYKIYKQNWINSDPKRVLIFNGATQNYKESKNK